MKFVFIKFILSFLVLTQNPFLIKAADLFEEVAPQVISAEIQNSELALSSSVEFSQTNVSHLITEEKAIIPQKRMGIEIETSVIKILSPSCEKLGFNFGSETIPSWGLEEDTLDRTFDQTPGFTEFDRNMELKTHGGKEHIAIDSIATEMELVLSTLYLRAIPQMELTATVLTNLLSNNVPVFPIDHVYPNFLIKSKVLSVKNRVVRPQITYQLPLELIPNVFKRLQSLRHLGISQFIADLTPKVTNEEIKPTKVIGGRLGEFFKIAAKNKEKGKPIRDYFKEQLATPYSLLPEDRMKGFTNLFLYYWYELFNNKEVVGVEPGLKQYLGIMSRVPLSQLYASLTNEEQRRFYEFMANHFVFGEQCLLRPYHDYDDNLLHPRVTLVDWFLSVVKEKEAENPTNKHVDLLSPPPGLPEEYSMGFLDINSHANGIALIEVRGYSSVDYSGKTPTIYQIKEFVSTESTWFFEN